jgi:hypothetical protein
MQFYTNIKSGTSICLQKRFLETNLVRLWKRSLGSLRGPEPNGPSKNPMAHPNGVACYILFTKLYGVKAQRRAMQHTGVLCDKLTNSPFIHFFHFGDKMDEQNGQTKCKQVGGQYTLCCERFDATCIVLQCEAVTALAAESLLYC